MSHSLCRIWVHGIMGTKQRQDFILPDAEPVIHELIKKEFEGMGCRVAAINGIENHVHVLFMLDKKYSIAQVFKQVKGSVSHEINLKSLIPFPFAWQVGYGAFAVSESRLSGVQKYIERQKEHHHGETYEEELSRYYEIFGIPKKEQKLLL